MGSPLRLFATGIAGIATFYFAFWVGGALLYAIGLPYGLGFPLGAAAAYYVGRLVWQRPSSDVPDGLLESVMRGALLLGAICFAAGFFGPLIFAPDANQGPLLGIFITGPAGAVVGALVGWIRWMRRSRSA